MVITDFDVKFIRKSIVRASNISIHPYTLSFSNLDRLSGRFPVTVMFTYPKPQVGDFSSVVSVIKTSLSETLNHYFPFSGQIVYNDKTGEPEILCNNQGIEVIESHANFMFASLDFHDLTNSLQKILNPPSPEIPMQLQVISYACGSFSISWNYEHLLADAVSFGKFIVSWCEVARNKPISEYPNHRRSIFQPRSPPIYNPSFDQSLIKCTMKELMLNTQLMTSYNVSLKRLYFIEASDILRLQHLANQDGKKKTKLEAFSAYLWKVLAVAVEDEESSKGQCNLGWIVEGRKKMTKLASNLVGNVLTTASGNASVQELKQASLSQVANKVHEAIDKVNNESHFMDAIDWVECHKPGEMFMSKLFLGMLGPSVMVSGSHFPVKEVDLGFGSPVFGTGYSTMEKFNAGYVNPQPSPTGDGTWRVFAIIWPKLAAALEADQNHIFKPMTASHIGLTTTPLISKY